MDQIGSAQSAAPVQVSDAVGAGRSGVVVGKPGGGVDGEKPSFQEVWSQIQAKMGAKPEKPREIKKTLDKDDFLKIMITQMQHQDPTSPFDADKMAAQIAQITSVEQLQNVNRTLTSMTHQNRPLERLAMTSLIGKTVTVDRSRFAHKEGDREALSFTLSQPAKETLVQVMSEAGEVVFETKVGPKDPGTVNIDWDGKKKNTMPAGSGNYMLKITAKNEQGMEVDTGAVARATIVGVSFDGQDPVFIIGDAKRQERIPMSNITQIDGGMPQSAGGDASGALPGALADAAKKKSSFFTFKPGEGSKNVDMDQLDPASAQALARYQAQRQAEKAAAPQQGAPTQESAPSQPAQAQEKGFPNGLDFYQGGGEKP